MGSISTYFSFPGVRILSGIILFLTASILLSSCSTPRGTTRFSRPTENLWDSLGMEQTHHTGISVYDVSKDRFIFRSNDKKYFTPASNAKLLTLYTALEIFDDYIPAAYYSQEQDTLIIWGGGDPGTFYRDHNDTTAFVRFLMDTDKQIVFSDQHFQTSRYGRGWAWDDYPYRFQAERTPFPVYQNKLWIERKHDTIVVIPEHFSQVVDIKRDTAEQLTRNETGTHYIYKYNNRIPYANSSIPASLYPQDVRDIWMGVTQKKIVGKKVHFRGGLEIEGSSMDTLAKYIMRDSDNFVSEQLLLAAALKATGQMDEKEIIRYMLDGSLSALPDSIRWIDGSGLSRYNQMTPGTLIWLLQDLLKQKGPDYFREIFAAGGKTGTIRDWITAPSGAPFIFAKSGTHRNTFNLSGLLITRQGNLLLFSWMNNHFMDRKDVERKMKLFLQHLYIQY